LTDLAESEGIAERIEFAAPVPPGGVVDALLPVSAGLALIQPACLSYRLSLPNKLFEYVAAGVPVLASDLPVIGRFVRDNEVGLVAPPDDVGEIAAKLTEILQADRNDALRVAVRRADAEIQWSREADLLAEIYDQAAAAVESREGHR
jgi:glycosyltransferase involved in cell wall biosynthesis